MSERVTARGAIAVTTRACRVAPVVCLGRLANCSVGLAGWLTGFSTGFSTGSSTGSLAGWPRTFSLAKSLVFK